MKQKIRFAPIIRVSTEKQAEKGESLNTQKKQIMGFVETLGGTIPEKCWRYSGQEHATPDQERKKLDQLLKDSGKGIFDAVIVCDASRWSRDNLKSKIGLATLRNHGVRFFIGTMEYDLAEPSAELILGVFTEFNQFAAREQSRKSILNRIERAKQGIPTGGKLPYGRVFDKKRSRWSIDKKKSEKIAWAAREYLSGKKMSDIARTLGMNHPNLWKILTKRSGNRWDLRFNKPDLNIDETITIKIPPLLTDETIEAIKAKAKANKTYHHGHIKYRYLLSRMIFCGHCGYAMFGQTNHSTVSYYRHARNRKNACEHPGFWVRADDVETAVFMHLFSALGNIPELERAIEQATPNKERVDQFRKTHSRLLERKKALNKKKSRFLDAVGDGLITGHDIKSKMDEIHTEEERIKDEIEIIESHLGSLSTKTQIRKRSSMWKAVLKKAYGNYTCIEKMSYEDKRYLVELALGGNDLNGARYGVYVRKGENDSVTYEIKGNLPNLNFDGGLPVSDLELIEALNIDDEYQDKQTVKAEIEAVKHNMLSKCHAHYRLGVHQRRRVRPAPRLRGLAGKTGPPCAGGPIPAQCGRGQCRRPHEAPDHGP
jgi:DNA invertase Pin-like site-specific DNA recombinase